jgi:hypothetical protein
MKYVFASILIASALLLSAGQNVNADTPSPRPAREPNKSADLSYAETEQHPTALPLSDSPDDPNTASASADKREHGGDGPSYIIAIFTVLTGIATSLIAWFNWQLVGVTEEMKRATADAARASKDSAIAAKESAEVAKETIGIAKLLERAWIVIDIEPTAYMLSVRREDYGISFKYTMRNCGRSLGWLCAGYEKADILPQTQPLPDTPQYAPHANLVPLAPNQSYTTGWYEQRVSLDREQWQDFALGKLKVSLYGIIFYRDSVGEYQTRFCVSVVPPVHEQPWEGKPPVTLLYYFDGPAAYNRHT